MPDVKNPPAESVQTRYEVSRFQKSKCCAILRLLCPFLLGGNGNSMIFGGGGWQRYHQVSSFSLVSSFFPKRSGPYALHTRGGYTSAPASPLNYLGSVLPQKCSHAPRVRARGKLANARARTDTDTTHADEGRHAPTCSSTRAPHGHEHEHIRACRGQVHVWSEHARYVGSGTSRAHLGQPGSSRHFTKCPSATQRVPSPPQLPRSSTASSCPARSPRPLSCSG